MTLFWSHITTQETDGAGLISVTACTCIYILHGYTCNKYCHVAWGTETCCWRKKAIADYNNNTSTYYTYYPSTTVLSTKFVAIYMTLYCNIIHKTYDHRIHTVASMEFYYTSATCKTAGVGSGGWVAFFLATFFTYYIKYVLTFHQSRCMTYWPCCSELQTCFPPCAAPGWPEDWLDERCRQGMAHYQPL